MQRPTVAAGSAPRDLWRTTVAAPGYSVMKRSRSCAGGVRLSPRSSVATAPLRVERVTPQRLHQVSTTSRARLRRPSTRTARVTAARIQPAVTALGWRESDTDGNDDKRPDSVSRGCCGSVSRRADARRSSGARRFGAATRCGPVGISAIRSSIRRNERSNAASPPCGARVGASRRARRTRRPHAPSQTASFLLNTVQPTRNEHRQRRRGYSSPDPVLRSTTSA